MMPLVPCPPLPDTRFATTWSGEITNKIIANKRRPVGNTYGQTEPNLETIFLPREIIFLPRDFFFSTLPLYHHLAVTVTDTVAVVVLSSTLVCITVMKIVVKL
jgi:hypothetical protein